MTLNDWYRVADETAAMGTRRVQFIGGEPTLHPDLCALVLYSLSRGLDVEVYTNLVRVTEAQWRCFSQPGVRLATSYYSSDPREHNQITGRRSHDRTLRNIHEALGRGISLRVGVVAIDAGQDVDGAVGELMAAGVAHVGVDHLRAVGRGGCDGLPNVDALCGGCASATLAVAADGDVWPCIMSRWLTLGNVRTQALPEIHHTAEPTRAWLANEFSRRPAGASCGPSDGGNPCGPQLCKPWVRS
jgi:MoaA/NifB/PqqE/SkfB family radical SAM enzyme